MDATEAPPQGGETPERGFETSAPAADGGRPPVRCVLRLEKDELRGVLDAAENPGEPTESMIKARREYSEAVTSGRLIIKNSRPDDDELPD